MTQPEAFAAPSPGDKSKQRRNTIIQAVVAVAVLVIVFGVILPEVIDYEQVGQILRETEPWQIGVLLLAGLVVYVPEGWLYAILLPGIGLWRGMQTWVASTAVASTLPAIDLVTRFGMYRSYGATTEASMLSVFLTGVFDNFVKFSLPVIGVLLLALLGIEDIDPLPVVAVIAAVILIATAVVVVGAVRSEAFTRRLAAFLQRVANWVLTKVKKNPLENVSERVVGVRDSAIELVKRSWRKALFASALGKLWTFVILLIAIRIVGIDEETLPTLGVFIVWSIVLLLQSIPITPGGIGIAAIGFVGLFTAAIGDQYSDQIAAAVVLYRLAQWALPIVIGWIVVFAWRRQVSSGKLPDPFAGSQSDAADASAA
jgi:uncharacterized protein (TIRG00374 family)